MQPKSTWVLTADQTEARIYRLHHRTLELVQKLPNAEGNLQNRELDSDRPGTSSSSSGGHRHSFVSEVSSHDHIVEKFAKRAATELEKVSSAHTDDDYVLVAEPHLLGLIRGKLGGKSAKQLRASLNKDLMHLPERELVERLGQVIPI